MRRGLGEDLDRRRLLGRRAGDRHLTGGDRDRAERVAQLELRRVDALGDVVPRLAVAGLGRFLATGVGEREQALARLGVGGDEALVLEELERRVDRAGARSPHAVGALLELLDHLVAVHRPLAQEREGGGAHVAPPGPAAGAASAAATRSAEAEGARAGRPTGWSFTGFGVLVGCGFSWCTSF